MISEKKKKIIFGYLIGLAIMVVIACAGFVVLRYQVEGEKNMPFNIGKIIVISSAVTTQNTDEEQTEEGADSFIWNEKVIQTNDIYMYIDKNNSYKKDAVIQSVKIENIQVLQKANIGKIQVYMPNSVDEELYKYINDYLVGMSLTYKGAASDNKKALEIGNQGGCICFSFANVGIGNYKSNEGEQIEQGAGILEKMEVSDENLKFKVSFDVIIDIGTKAYKGTVVLDLPVEGLVGNKETHREITDFSDVIFKRCNVN